VPLPNLFLFMLPTFVTCPLPMSPTRNASPAIEPVATPPPSRPALSRPLASHSFPVSFGPIRLRSDYTGDAQGRDEGSLPPPPLAETQPLASLGLPPQPERSLRPRRALAHDRHSTANTNTAPPLFRMRAPRAKSRANRSEARSSESVP